MAVGGCFLFTLVVCWHVIASTATYVVYGIDKRAAGRAKGRVREKTMHLMELAGGWPGAVLAQKHFKHKRRKAEYMLAFRLIVAIHALGWMLAAVIWWEL